MGRTDDARGVEAQAERDELVTDSTRRRLPQAAPDAAQRGPASAPRTGSASSSAPWLALQATAGNRAVTQAIAHGADRTAVQRAPAGTPVAEPRKRPSWVEPSSGERPPGVPVEGTESPINVAYTRGEYTEADRQKLLELVGARFEENRRRIGGFLNDFVNASVTITAKYVIESTKQSSTFRDLVRFAISEGLASLAGGVVGLA